MIKVAFQIGGGKTETRANKYFFFPTHCSAMRSPDGHPVAPQSPLSHRRCQSQKVSGSPYSLSPSPQPRVSPRLSQARIIVAYFNLQALPPRFQRLAPQPRGHTGCHESRMNQPLEACQCLPGCIHLEHAASLLQKCLQSSPRVL